MNDMAQRNSLATIDLQLFAEDPAPVEPVEPVEPINQDPVNPVEPPAPTDPPADPAQKEPTEPVEPPNLSDYKPTIPEGFTINQESLDAFKPLASELGLNPDQANKLVGLYCDSVKDLPQRIAANITQNCENTYAEFIDGVKGEMGRNFEKNMGQINSLMTKYGDDKTPEYFQAAMTALSGFAPDAVGPFFNAIVKMSKDAADPQFRLGQGAPSGPKTLGQILYPNMK
ncbi:MAG: peptidase [Firmicutes bacterium]|nr:peptidase [Bacillota bacterium]